MIPFSSYLALQYLSHSAWGLEENICKYETVIDAKKCESAQIVFHSKKLEKTKLNGPAYCATSRA
jgi:hypothetical protein